MVLLTANSPSCNFFCGVCIIAVAASPSIAGAQQGSPSAARELKLSTALGPAYPLGKAGELWASLIRERSGGRLAVTHFPGATLSRRDPAREFGALSEGAFELAVGSAQAWAPQIPALNLFALPWLARNDAALEALVADKEVRDTLGDSLERSGVVAVDWAANGFLELATRLPVHKPADVARWRIRTPSLPLVDDTMIALGARPDALSGEAARAAIAKVELDGALTSVAAYAASRSYAVGLPHLLVWGAYGDAMVFAVNARAWRVLSDAEREIVRTAAQDASRQALGLSRRLAGDAALTKLAEQGADIHRLTPAGKDAYRAAAQPVYDKWTGVVGVDLVRIGEAAVAAPNTSP